MGGPSRCTQRDLGERRLGGLGSGHVGHRDPGQPDRHRRDGHRAVGNAFFGAQFGGIFLNGSTNTVIGGPNSGEGNVIAFNAGDGVTVFGFGTETGNTIRATRSMARFTSRFRSIRSSRSTSATTAPRPTTSATGTRASTTSRTTRSSPLLRRSPRPPARTSWASSTARCRPPTRSTSTRTLPSAPPPRLLRGPDLPRRGQRHDRWLGHLSIDVTLAATIAAGDVVVATATDPNGNTSELTPRIVFSIDPTSGPSAGGTAVTVKGTEFEDGLTLTIGGQPASSVVVADDHTITASSPSSVRHVERHHCDRPERDHWHADQGLPRRFPRRAPDPAVLHLRHDARAERHHGRREEAATMEVDQPTLRQQMAVFMLKAEHGLCYTPPPCIGHLRGRPLLVERSPSGSRRWRTRASRAAAAAGTTARPIGSRAGSDGASSS